MYRSRPGGEKGQQEKQCEGKKKKRKRNVKEIESVFHDHAAKSSMSYHMYRPPSGGHSNMYCGSGRIQYDLICTWQLPTATAGKGLARALRLARIGSSSILQGLVASLSRVLRSKCKQWRGISNSTCVGRMFDQMLQDGWSL